MKKIISVWLTFITVLSLACNFSVSTANIAEATLAKDAEGAQPATVFDQDDAIYALVSLKNAPDDTTLKAVWTAVEADGTDPNLLLDENTLTSGDGNMQFSLTNDNLWPVGTYKVDLYLNDKLDRTLDFTVEGNIAAQAPSPTPEPEPTVTPKPTVTPAPTETEADSSLDSLAMAADEPTEEVAQAAVEEVTEDVAEDMMETAAEEFEPLPLQAEPYTHPSGGFTFAVPEDWELIDEDETSATFSDGQTYMGAVFTDGEIVYDESDMQNYIDQFVDSYISGFAESYEVIEQNVQPDDSIYVSLTYINNGGDSGGDADFFFEQRETIVFVLIFDTPVYNELQSTWNEIIATYAVDPQAALAAIPAPETTSVAVAPTVAPEPEPAVLNPFAPQAGRSRLYVFNEFNEELTFTIDGQEHKIPPAGIDNPTSIDLNPGRYTYTVSIPGGAANGEVTLTADQSWSVGVRGDGAVYNAFQVYP